jgi:hypothetical protein
MQAAQVPDYRPTQSTFIDEVGLVSVVIKPFSFGASIVHREQFPE